MAITFVVDDVEAVRDRLTTRSLGASLERTLGVALTQVSGQTPIVADESQVHPLLAAVHLAFAQHRPLVLTPDQIWLTITQGFAAHVDWNAEALRTRFVRHEGRTTLTVHTTEMPDSTETWTAVVHALSDRIAEHVGPGLQALLACDFSTTTDVARVASAVVMMSAFKRYFDLRLECICGVPEVTLAGTPADWAGIRRRFDVLSEYDLSWWADAVRPVLDELVHTSEGRPDPHFWQSLYKPEEAYAEDESTGWVMRLFPYLESGERNPAVQAAKSGEWTTPGVRPSSVPGAWRSAKLRVQRSDGQAVSLALYGGFAGVHQQDDGALTPEIAWAVGQAAPMSRLVERVVAEHVTTPIVPLDRGSSRFQELPAELLELYDHVGTAVLFGRWRLLARADLRILVGDPTRGFLGRYPGEAAESHAPSETLAVLPFCTIEGDPRFLASYHGVVVLCDPRVAVDVEEIPVVATTTLAFFEYLFACEGGLWFDSLPTEAVLYQHLPSYHSHLRRALREPRAGDPIPSDLSARESKKVVFILYGGASSAAHRDFLWQALQRATGTALTFDELFAPKPGRYPIHVLQALGMK